MNNNAKRSNEGWTVADAKARLSEILRLANEELQFIGANKTHVIVSADTWESLRERPAMGKWLVDSLKDTGELVLPDRGGSLIEKVSLMSDHILLDTNIISELWKVNPSPQVVKFVAELDRYWWSVITLHELKFGIESMPQGKKRDGLVTTLIALKEKFTLQTIDIDSEIAELAGTYRARARKNGTTLHLADSLIASCCIFSGGLVLATRIADDFTEYPVRVVNPFLP